MRKILFGTTALLLNLVALGAGSPQRAAAQDKGGGGSPFSASAQLVANLDINKAVGDIIGTVNAERDRGAWVRSLLEQMKSKTQGKVSIMVFNMEQPFDFNPPGKVQFTKVTFNGRITYGIWVFHSAAVFKNKGDGGFINWAFYGVFNRRGGTVTFSDASVFSGPNPRGQSAQTAGPKGGRPSDQKRK